MIVSSWWWLYHLQRSFIGEWRGVCWTEGSIQVQAGVSKYHSVIVMSWMMMVMMMILTIILTIMVTSRTWQKLTLHVQKQRRTESIPNAENFLSIAQKDGKSTSSKNIFQASLKRSDSFANTEFCNRTSKAHGEIQRLHKHILVKENPINHIYKLQDYCFTCLKLNTHTPPSAA